MPQITSPTSSHRSDCDNLQLCVLMSSDSNANDVKVSQIRDAGGGSSNLDTRFSGYGSPAYVSGWMYINQSGQMCGPYIQHQLYEGLYTGFLPEELPVYPILNGKINNPVPLNYFKQFPDHVATGFVYFKNLSANTKFLLSGDESCWLFEDEEGIKHGPHSLNELHSWCHYGYVRNSVMVINYQVFASWSHFLYTQLINVY